jgi:hypothetical protein
VVDDTLVVVVDGASVVVVDLGAGADEGVLLIRIGPEAFAKLNRLEDRMPLMAPSPERRK